MAEPLLIARNVTTACVLLPELANRHGLITGATGTGKTVTLQTLAEGFSRIGVPVFMADVKGDLSGISQPGQFSGKLAAVLKERGLEAPAPMPCPTKGGVRWAASPSRNVLPRRQISAIWARKVYSATRMISSWLSSACVVHGAINGRSAATVEKSSAVSPGSKRNSQR